MGAALELYGISECRKRCTVADRKTGVEADGWSWDVHG